MSFLDLQEVRVARLLRREGVPWSRVHEAAVFFRREWNSPHPFAIRRFRTDGREVFAELGRSTEDRSLLRIGGSQYVFEALVEGSLFDVLDFRDDGRPWRMWPRGREGGVVVDPGRGFGRPILEEYGIPVSVLVLAYAANDNDVGRVASAFELPREAIEAALRFEAASRLAA